MPGVARYVVSEEMDQERPQTRFYQPEYYRQFFNVDTSDVFFRLVRALFPFKRDFIDVVRKNPDLSVSSSTEHQSTNNHSIQLRTIMDQD